MTDVTYTDLSILSTVATCSTKAVMRYIHGYTNQEESAALKAGTAFHEAVAVYCRGGTRKEALAKFRDEYMEWATENVDPDDKYMGRLSYENTRLILKYWMRRHPMDAFPFIVEPEHVEVGFAYPLTKSGDIVLTGRLDAGPVTAREGGAKYVLDWKTTGRIYSTWLEKFRLAAQVTGYIWGVQQHTPERIEGAYIGAVEFSKLPGLSDPTRKCRDPQHGGVTYEECQELHLRSEVVATTRTPQAVKAWRRDAIGLSRRFVELLEQFSDLDDIHKVPMEGTFTDSCTYCEFKLWCQTGRLVENVKRMLVIDPRAPYEAKKARWTKTNVNGSEK